MIVTFSPYVAIECALSFLTLNRLSWMYLSGNIQQNIDHKLDIKLSQISLQSITDLQVWTWIFVNLCYFAVDFRQHFRRGSWQNLYLKNGIIYKIIIKFKNAEKECTCALILSSYYGARSSSISEISFWRPPPEKSLLRQFQDTPCNFTLPICNTIAKIAKNTGKEVKTTMEKLWLNSFGDQSFVLH